MRPKTTVGHSTRCFHSPSRSKSWSPVPATGASWLWMTSSRFAGSAMTRCSSRPWRRASHDFTRNGFPACPAGRKRWPYVTSPLSTTARPLAPAWASKIVNGTTCAVQQRDHPADGAAERERALAVLEPGVPAHALGEGEAAEQGRDDSGQHLARLATGRALQVKKMDLGGSGRVLRRLLELVDRDAALLGEAGRGARPGAGRVPRDLERRAPDLVFAIGLAGVDLSRDDEAARASKRTRRPGDRDARAAASSEKRWRSCSVETGQPGGRHLLDADFQKKLRHVAPRSECHLLPRIRSASSPTYRAAIAHASLRIPRIMPARWLTEIAPRASSTLNACEALRVQS